MRSYIVCEILVFKPVLHKKYSIHQVHIQWQSKSFHDLSIFRTDLFVAYANEANIREVKLDVNGRRQTAKITSVFEFFFSNP